MSTRSDGYGGHLVTNDGHEVGLSDHWNYGYWQYGEYWLIVTMFLLEKKLFWPLALTDAHPLEWGVFNETI